jgi:outer membrane protein TolC
MASLYPDITLGGGVGSTGAMTDFLTGATDRYGLGIAIQWQANQHLARARVAAASAGAKLALARLDGVVLTALREVQSALIAYGQDYQQDADLGIAQSRGHQSEEEARQLYVGGKIGALTLLDAQLVRTATDVAVAESHARLAGDEITVFMTLGGGWE